jgi:cytosine/adenosine deaminase-related metal-dependent hydrolase
MILRARLVLPVSRPPIENGAVALAGDRIAAVGPWPEVAARAGGPVQDLGEQILLPGLVNAHCHLDYTDLAGLIPPPRNFTDWIKSITALKATWSYSEFAASWLNGARMLQRTGTTTVGDVEAAPELLPELWDTTPLRVCSFLEMTGVKSRRQPRLILQEAVAKIDSLQHVRCKAWLSPHAAYSTTPELLRLSAQCVRERGWRLTTHVAESAEEFEMFRQAGGPMFDWLRRNERDMSDCGYGSPVQCLARHGYLSERLLAIHVNYLAPGDERLLAEEDVSVVHCPRSHAYFGHAAFPYRALAAAGVNVCLGTDSLVTVPRVRGQPAQLDLFAEMRAFAAAFPQVAPPLVLQMVTVNAARALGLAGQIGELGEGAFADCIVVPFAGAAAHAAAAVVQHDGTVTASMIGGRWV